MLLRGVKTLRMAMQLVSPPFAACALGGCCFIDDYYRERTPSPMAQRAKPALPAKPLAPRPLSPEPVAMRVHIVLRDEARLPFHYCSQRSTHK